MTEMSRPIAVERILPRDHSTTVDAVPAELPAIAARLHIPAVHALSCRWRLQPDARGRVVADGHLTARVEQECVVSLEPLAVDVVHDFRVVFLPSDAADAEPDAPDSPDILPYDGPTIDLGEATVEELALALDPFPRRPDAELPSAETPGSAVHPFAALGRLRAGG